MPRQIVELLPAAAFYVLALAAQVSGYTNSTVAFILFGTATLMLLIPACHHARNWHQARKGRGMYGFDSWLVLGPLAAVAAIALALFFYGLGLRSSSVPDRARPALSEPFVKDPVLAFGADEKAPLVFLGTPTLTTDTLRVVVEYSIFNNGWMSPVRYEIDPIVNPVRGQRAKVQVASIGSRPNGGVNDLWWGTDPSSDKPVTNNPVYDAIVAVSLTRGRIVVIGPKNEEQNAVYFEIVRGLNDQKGNIRMNVLQAREVADWISEWEAAR